MVISDISHSCTTEKHELKPDHVSHCLSTALFEPLKVCLDDDTDEDEEFDDDENDSDYFFGDEDFETLRETLKRISTPLKPAANNIQPMLMDESSHSLDDKSSSSALHHGAQLPPSPSIADAANLRGASTASLGKLTEASTSCTSCNSLYKKARSKRRVSLHSDVAVVQIPMRTEYPALVRQKLWSSATELYQNAARNSIEFAAEGWNWRTVTDDDHMILSPSGERVHPVHVTNSLSMQHVAAAQNREPNVKYKSEVESVVSMDTEPVQM